MDLHVKISGLCMIVPDRGAGVMHVLLPATGGMHVERHDPELHYKGKPIDLTHRVLDLSKARGTGTEYKVAEPALQVAALVGRELDAEQYGPKPRRTVLSRVSLPFASEIGYGTTARYRIKVKQNGVETERKVRLTNEVTWKVSGFELEDAPWELAPLPASGSTSASPLPALNGGDIHLEIRHWQRGAKPSKIGDRIHHVRAYYDLYGDSVTGPIPELDEPPNGVMVPPPGGSPFNCMVAVGGPWP